MKTLTREQAIQELREALLRLVDDEHSMCEVASRLGIHCRGFRQFSDDELRRRYDWIVRKRGAISRAELEDLANRWQIARQFVQNTALSCDTQTREHDTCRGWDNFTDAEIEEYVRRIAGDEVSILPESRAARSAT